MEIVRLIMWLMVWLICMGSVAGWIVGWLLGMVNMFRVVANRKEGAPLFPNWYEGPFNYLFRPSQLTDQGLAARRWCYYGIALMVLCTALMALVWLACQIFSFPTT